VPPTSVSRLEIFVPTTEVAIGYEQEVTLNPGKATIMVATFKLEDKSISADQIVPSSTFLTDYLGLSKTSKHATDLLWLDRIRFGADNSAFVENCTSDACLEQILGVTSIPVEITSSGSASGCDVLLDRSKVPPEIVNSLSQYIDFLSIIASNQINASQGIAIMRDIMVHHYVDLQHTLYVIPFPRLITNQFQLANSISCESIQLSWQSSNLHDHRISPHIFYCCKS
jgi:hypothetical protein